MPHSCMPSHGRFVALSMLLSVGLFETDLMWWRSKTRKALRKGSTTTHVPSRPKITTTTTINRTTMCNNHAGRPHA